MIQGDKRDDGSEGLGATGARCFHGERLVIHWLMAPADLDAMLQKWLRAARLPKPSPARGPCLDVAALQNLERDLGEGGAELLASLIEQFLKEFPAVLERLDSACAAAAWERVSFEAHRARSSTSNLGAVDLTRLCQDLEQSARGPDIPRSLELAAALRVDFAYARASLLDHARALATRGEPGRVESL